MNLTTFKKRFLVGLLTAAMLGTSASAALADDINSSQEQTTSYTYQAPTAPMAVDSNIITATAHRAASPVLGMLGLNATSGFGMINGGAPADYTAAVSSAALGVWGSSINDSPDPYYWNYFYNYYAKENGLEVVADSAVGGDALTNANVAASPMGADKNLVEEYGNVSYSLSTRPMIAVGCSSGNGADTDGYNDQLATINSFTPDSQYYHEGDETYSPKLVSYQTTYIKQMIESVKRLADATTEVAAETGKTTRYGDVQVIASDYEKYVYGIISYVKEELAATGQKEKTVAVVDAINADGTYNLCNSLSTSATSLVRAYEYSMPVSETLTDVYGLTVTKDQLLTADVIITINNRNLAQSTLLESFGDSSYDGIIISNTPAALYGMTMNSVENAMGYAYVIASMYCDIIDIDPVELCAYFYEHFYHISDRAGIATVVKTNFASTILPSGVSTTLSDTYSAAAVEAMIAKGMAYYTANTAAFEGDKYALIGLDSWVVDTTSGIGSATEPVEIELAAPELKSVSSTNSGVSFKWAKVDGAASYAVYRKTSTGSYKKLGTTASTSYTDTTAKSGSTYYYTVRCLKEDGSDAGQYNSTGLKITYVAAAKISSVSNLYSGMKVSWGKVSGAASYSVYRKTSTGSFKKIGSATSTSYTDTTAKSGTKYTYTIRCVNKSGNLSGAYDKTGVSKLRLAGVKPSVKNTSKGPKATWSKVTGAKGYYVYRKTTSGSYKLLKKTTSLSYTDTTAKKGSTYYYKVLAYNGSVKGSYKAVKIKVVK